MLICPKFPTLVTTRVRRSHRSMDCGEATMSPVISSGLLARVVEMVG